jgi:hypothetical protein
MPVSDPAARHLAAELIAEGKPVAAFFRGVCVIFGQGENPAFVKHVARIKGDRRENRPLSTMLPAEFFIELLDPEEISPALHSIFLDPAELTARLGSLCFVRAPISQAAAQELPQALVTYNENGVPLVQNIDPVGHRYFHQLVHDMFARGVLFPAGTSLNISGQPEMVDQDLGIEFSKRIGIPLFLTDDDTCYAMKGSHGILGIDHTGITLLRDGNLPVSLFTRLLETPINTANAQRPKFPQFTVRSDLIAGLEPCNIRRALLLYLRGWTKERIRSVLRKSGVPLHSVKMVC